VTRQTTLSGSQAVNPRLCRGMVARLPLLFTQLQPFPGPRKAATWRERKGLQKD
jgi:hypothetical protein